jgi:hypothetical protein
MKDNSQARFTYGVVLESIPRGILAASYKREAPVPSVEVTMAMGDKHTAAAFWDVTLSHSCQN